MAISRARMDHTHFQIKIRSPFGLLHQPTDLHFSGNPKYRIVNARLVRLQGDDHQLEVWIHADDLPETARHSELLAFRDAMLEVLSVIATVPVTRLENGSFTFPLGGRKYEARMLAPEPEGARSPLPNVGPVFLAPNMAESEQAANYFLWQAISADEPVFRFMNLAIVCELIANTDSKAPTSKPLTCQKCSAEMGPCTCGHKGRKMSHP